MLSKYGWAAFLALATVVFSAGSAMAGGPGATFACFTPSNASLIGRLGPNDTSVRRAFEAGACLALPAGTPMANAGRSGALWRFKALGGAPDLYAADWAAGFAGTGDDQMIAAFGQFLPVTGRLLQTGYGFADCYDASERLNVRWRDFDRRLDEYESRGNRRFTPIMIKVVLYMSDESARLGVEWERLQVEGRALDGRCAPYQTVEMDHDFVAFVRSARHTV